VACHDFGDLARLLNHVESGLGGQLSVFEALWPEFYALTSSPPAPHRAPLPHGHGLYALIEAQGADPMADTERLESVLAAALEQGLIVDAVIAKSDAERRALWAPREDVGQVRRLGPTHHFDVSLDLMEMPAYLDAVRGALAGTLPEAQLLVFGHVADGNLHLVIAAGTADTGAVERCVYEPLKGRAASISAEHGIGLERRQWLSISRTLEEIATMRLLKRALDPHNLLNPGKVVDVTHP
jgi:FAD/FMN-containing dehydrogenase